MKEWEAKVLGAATPWWLLLLMWAPGAWLPERHILALASLALGTVASLHAAAVRETNLAQHIASFFLLGVASIVGVALVCAILAGAMLAFVR